MMDELINGVLMLSRVSRQELSRDRLDMRRIASDVYDQLSLLSAGPRHEFKLKDMPDSLGDPVLVKQVFSNLISNAIKFSGKRRRPKIEIGGYRNSDFCVYCVNDNGAGFNMKDYDKLFAIFQRLHNESDFEGTGVGLAIVQKIIQRHGGRIWAESRVNKGSQFYFSLPAAVEVS
jgi:light-regulated signal transduction histidine kinase (bacteriophytochrome)